MSHPFQSLVVVHRSSAIGETVCLITAACGSELFVSRTDTGSVVSRWSANVVAQSSAQGEQQSAERPAKKHKTQASSTLNQAITLLTASPDGRYVVAVTNDKHVRVFEIKAEGELLELSRRCMPKRPCAIHVLPDNATILCGDKFGDVYSLPLIARPLENADPGNGQAQTSAPRAAQPFKPIATVKTVHTQGNRRALESQQNQRDLTARSKEPLEFEHQLLLGHVSMLTDLAYATRVVDGHERRYIISADRDEHIRVSRGPPQSHIIEGYCLGHTDFVSRICVIPGHNILVSGGGDDWLGVWDWCNFKLRRKIETFGSRIRDSMRTDLSFENTTGRIAVTGIWLVPLSVDENTELAIAVACERLPVLAVIPLSELSSCGKANEIKFTVIRFDDPIVDVAVLDNSVVISFDARHTPRSRLCAYRFSTRDSSCSDKILIEAVQLATASLDDLNGLSVEGSDDKDLDDLLYGVSNLRKWSGGADGEQAKDEDE